MSDIETAIMTQNTNEIDPCDWDDINIPNDDE